MLRSLNLVAILVATAACTTDHHGTGPTGGAVQMNDVTVLFPLTDVPSKYLAASDAGALGPLLPEALYTAAGPITGPGDSENPSGFPGSAAYGDLHVVAMRLDPCFAALAPDPHGVGCTNQLRLVFQDVTADGTQSTAVDSALHVFYEISRDDLIAITEAIGAERAAATSERLGGLAPHPLIVSQGLDGALSASVKALILDYAGASNLTRVTELSATRPDLIWAFQGFDVSDANAATITPMMIPTLAGATMQQFERDGITNVAPDPDGDFTPATTSADNLEPLADVNTASALTDAQRQTAFTGLVHVDNPHDNSPNTIDCASCHLATPAELGVAKPIYSLDEASAPDAFTADGVYVLASELQPTMALDGGLNIHSLSYVGQSPGINQRVVNETAAIVAYLNDNAD